jgi:hypothetical protein
VQFYKLPGIFHHLGAAAPVASRLDVDQHLSPWLPANPQMGVVSIVQDATEWATVDLHVSWSDELAIADT